MLINHKVNFKLLDLISEEVFGYVIGTINILQTSPVQYQCYRIATYERQLVKGMKLKLQITYLPILEGSSSEGTILRAEIIDISQAFAVQKDLRLYQVLTVKQV